MIDLANSSHSKVPLSSSSNRRYDAIVVGAGIVGIAHAALLARAGRKVLVVEKDPAALGASIRNFGMIWPIGQPLGRMRDMAMRSRNLWREFLDASKTWYAAKGSLHLAYADDELTVLNEFVDLAKGEDEAPFTVSPEDARRLSPHIRAESLRGAMFSESELCVDPRITVGSLAAYLAEAYGTEFRFGAHVDAVEPGVVFLGEEAIEADAIFLCLGPTPGRLFPELLWGQGTRLCKLQMLRARPKSLGYRIGPHLCAGLTLSHYSNFAPCPSLAALKNRLETELPEYAKHHIHLLVSQHEDGTLTIGDSHEYGQAFSPFSDDAIDALMLRYLDTFLPNEGYEVVQRWQGFYPKHPAEPYLIEHPIPGVTVVNVLSGIGMTLSFGLADRVLNAREVGA